jgi:hypothetical protein
MPRASDDLSSHPFSNPIGAVNGLATTSLPSAILSGSAGNTRGAGPSTTLPPSLGSKIESWHGQDNSCSVACHPSTSQPLCVQMLV